MNQNSKQVLFSDNHKPIFIYTNDVEEEAKKQLVNTASLPFIHHHIAAMPDVHWGLGATIGSVVPTIGAVIPAAIGVDIGCLDKDTEVLTRSGWKRICEYESNEEILGYDAETDVAKFVVPDRYIQKYSEWFYRLYTTKGVDQYITPDHKVLFYSGYKSIGFSPKEYLASEFVEKHNSLQKGMTGGFKTTFKIQNDYYGLTNNQIRIQVMIAADGCLRERKTTDNVVEIHVKKQRKIDRCEKLLAKANSQYKKYIHKDGTVTISFIPPVWKKSLNFVYYCSVEQLKVVLDEMKYWDGTFSYKEAFSSNSKDFADAVQFAYNATGTRAGIQETRYANKNWNATYQVYPTKNEYVGIEKSNIELVKNEDSIAYCFTMPTGFFVARRNNNIFITGNCGMVAQRTSIRAEDLPDSLKDLRSNIEREIPVGFSVHRDIHPSAKCEWSFLQKEYGYLLDTAPSLAKKDVGQQLGTLGGGNHFIELCLDEEDYLWIMLHSGSRGIGNLIGRHYIELAKKDMERHFIHLPDKNLAYLVEGNDNFNAYVRAVLWAQEYALKNREIMLAIMFDVLGKFFDYDLTEIAVNCHHNYVVRENHYGSNVWLTRKGAIRAREGDLGIIPGSMGTKSYIVRGLGNKESFCSCSHGAGRKYSRKKAKEVFSTKDLEEQTKGVERRKDSGVLDEIPAAYKDIDQVMENQKDLVEVVHTLKSVLTVKG